jgi:hypothetical protein
MLTGVMPTFVWPTKTVCKSSEDAYYTQHSKYKIYPTAWLPNIKFDKAQTTLWTITKFWINSKDCAPINPSTVKTQNYISTLYQGRIPYRFYGPKTAIGTEFQITLRNNDVNNRYFASVDADISGTHIGDINSIYSKG